jgi:hypothetical protein
MDKTRITKTLRDVARKYRAMAAAAPDLARQYFDTAEAMESAAEIVEGGDSD